MIEHNQFNVYKKNSAVEQIFLRHGVRAYSISDEIYAMGSEHASKILYQQIFAIFLLTYTPIQIV